MKAVDSLSLGILYPECHVNVLVLIQYHGVNACLRKAVFNSY